MTLNDTMPSLIDDDSDSEFYSEDDIPFHPKQKVYPLESQSLGKKKRKKNKKKSSSASADEDYDEVNSVSSQAAEDERLLITDFWVSLSQEDRQRLVTQEKQSVLKKLFEHRNDKCDCSTCGRQRYV